MSIQADMRLWEYGFDSKLVSNLAQNIDIIALSGRGTHSFETAANSYVACAGFDRSLGSSIPWHIARVMWKLLLMCLPIRNTRGQTPERSLAREAQPPTRDLIERAFPDISEFQRCGRAAFLETLVDFEGHQDLTAEKRIWLGQTIMRGPLIMKAEPYRRLGGFDLDASFQGFDDHDIVLRAYKHEGLRCGFTPIGYPTKAPQSVRNKPMRMSDVSWTIIKMTQIRHHIRSASLSQVRTMQRESFPGPQIRD